MAGKSKSKTSSGQAAQAITPPVNALNNNMNNVVSGGHCGVNSGGVASGIGFSQNIGPSAHPVQGQIYPPQIQTQIQNQAYSQVYGTSSTQNVRNVQNEYFQGPGQGQGHAQYVQQPQHMSQCNPPTQLTGQTSMPTSDNGTLVEMIQQMNNNFMARLSAIEKNVSKLNTIECDIQLMRSDMYQLQINNSQISKRILVVEKSCETISDLFDDAKNENSNLHKEISDMKSENKTLKSNAAQYDRKCQDLSSEMQELKARSMQQNLLFFGLAEPPAGVPDGTEAKLRDFLKTELTLEDPSVINIMEFDRIHRLGRLRGNRISNPRPIVARFTRYKDRETIRLAAKELNVKRNGFNIREQFPPEMEQNRKRLYPLMRQYQQNPQNRVALVRDKLYINGEQYMPPRENERNNELGNEQPPQRNESLNRSDRRFVRGVRPNQPYRAETYNRFDVLESDFRPSTVKTGKRVLSSPEQEETLLKRYRDRDIIRYNDIIHMDSVIEETEDISLPQRQSTGMLLDMKTRTVDTEPGSNSASHEYSATVNSSEPVFSTNISQVNKQTVTAEVHSETSGASCTTGQVDNCNGDNAVRHEDPQ